MGSAVLAVLCAVSLASAEGYVGSKACGECHEAEYARFQKHSKKAHSWESVKVMASDLTQKELANCYECHTTGYGKGGFRSYESTPELADVGCETCHGAGAAHADGGDPSLIRRVPEVEQCQVCHNAERVQDFDFKPLIHSGAH